MLFPQKSSLLELYPHLLVSIYRYSSFCLAKHILFENQEIDRDSQQVSKHILMYLGIDIYRIVLQKKTQIIVVSGYFNNVVSLIFFFENTYFRNICLLMKVVAVAVVVHVAD